MDDTQKIIGFEGDTLVRASAGTGKTFLLVKKFVSLLKRKDEKGNFTTHIENILALTFTDKAANEMRIRIGEEITKEVAELKKQVDDKDAKKLAVYLIECRRKISQAFISTIHSFCARLLMEHPIEAGIDPHFEILDEQSASTVQGVALVKYLIQKLKERDEPVTRLAYRFGFDSDFAYDNSLVTIIKSLLPLVRASGVEWDKLLVNYDTALKNIKRRLVSIESEAVQELLLLEPFAKSVKQVEAFTLLSEQIKRINPAGDIKGKEGLEKATKLYACAKKLNYKKDDSKIIAQKIKELAKEYKALLTSFSARESAKDAKSVTENFYRHMQINIKGRGKLDFDDLQEKTLLLFSRNNHLRERYQQHFNYLLVDEFQDVNGMQKKIFDLLAPAGDGKLFIVGDSKQAIYGFRGGDYQLFESYQKEIKKSGGSIFDITTNHRSNSHLVEFTNRLFANRYTSIFNEHDECKSKRKAGSIPSVETIPVTSILAKEDKGGADVSSLNTDQIRFAEGVLIAKRILGMVEKEKLEIEEDGVKRKINYGDIAILFRKFTSLSLYESAFNKQGVKFTVYKGAGFYQRQEIIDVINLLSYLDNKQDKLSLVATLRSPFAGLSDATILKLRRDRKGALSKIREFLDGKKLPKDIKEKVEIEKIKEFGKLIKELSQIKDRLLVSELIEALFEKSRIAGILGVEEDGLQKTANLFKLIESARMMESNSTVTLKNFLRFLKERYETQEREAMATTASNAEMVTIMTMHQSKGLEFPVVFVVDIDSRKSAERSPVIFNTKEGIAVKHFDLQTLSLDAGKVFENIKELNKESMNRELDRLFYVAVTRARDRLVLSGRNIGLAKSGTAEAIGSLAQEAPHLFNNSQVFTTGADRLKNFGSAYAVLKNELVKKQALPRERKTESFESGLTFFPVSALTLFQKCPKEYFFAYIFGLSTTFPAEEKKSVSPAQTGSAVHQILEESDFYSDKKKYGNYLQERLANLIPALTLSEIKTISREMKAVYNSTTFKKLRAGELKEVGREIPLTALLGKGNERFGIRGQIDLLIKDKNDIPTVVDYKYSLGKGDISRAKMQLSLYALSLSLEMPFKKINCQLLYMKGGKPKTVEWVLISKELKSLEKKLLKSAKEIDRLEKLIRPLYGRIPEESGWHKLLPDRECPDKRCRFADFCLE